MTRYSVIIPTLNEADQITTCIQAVRQLDPDVEVIVADGGSRDQTPALAQASGARVVAAPRGRGVQLNAGAAVASGDIFVFACRYPITGTGIHAPYTHICRSTRADCEISAFVRRQQLLAGAGRSVHVV